MDERPTGGNQVTRFVSHAAERLRSIGAPRHPAASQKKEIVREIARVPALARSAADRLVATNSSGGGWWIRSLIALVVAPSILFFIYAAMWQSSGYEAEARVTVRGAQEFRGSSTDASSIISRVAGGGAAAKSTIQDAYIVVNYVKSEAIILDLGGAGYMEKYYGSPGIDYFSRLPRGATIEELLRYWLKRVVASVDTMSGIVTIKVEAFQPTDASQIAQDIVRLSENLINKITERSRTDAVQRAENEVARAADRLAATRDKLTAFRDQSAIIDPAIRAKNVAEVIAKLTLDKVAIESSLATLEGSLRPDSPSQRIQRTKLATIDEQIARLNKSLTDPQNDSALSAQIATYERLKLDEQFDELMYTISQSSYQRARQELERRQLYLVVVVPPTTPQQAAYPTVMSSTLLLFAALFIFWSIGALIAASIADQMV
jgi:capsular polysaccharide transport system permease protein